MSKQKKKKPLKDYAVEICVTKWITHMVKARSDKEAETKAIRAVTKIKHSIYKKEIEANPIERF